MKRFMKHPLTSNLMRSAWTSRMITIALLSTMVGGILGSIGPVAQAKPTPTVNGPQKQPSPDDSLFWVPVARLNPDQPQRITINNKTGVSLDYLVTDQTNFRILEPGKSTTLSNLATPLFLNINPQESNYRVKYTVAVEAKTNTLNVNVILTNGEDNRTLNVNETGAVYLY